ncbi:MAG: DUF2270 domain-containing protein [Bryobacteraceae bacterium]|nr:DUF2270 domain-containing protein [Bryobacteraceae bacterium]
MLETEPTSPPPADRLLPSNSQEQVNSIAHYYRGELSRMIAWRDRLDHTTNWAIAASAGMLSVSLSSPDQHHGIILCCVGIVFLLLGIESRRYRFFDVSRRRVRLLEQNYYARIFVRTDAEYQADWRDALSRDLLEPRYHLTVTQAMGQRLRRNYGWIFLVLLTAWWLKVSTDILNPRTGETRFVHTLDQLLRNAAISYIPGWLVAGGVALFAGWLVYLIQRCKNDKCGTQSGGVEV